MLVTELQVLGRPTVFSCPGSALQYVPQAGHAFLERRLWKCREAPTELQLIALTQLLAVAHVDPAAPAAHVCSRLPWLRAFLSHVNAAVRLAAARLLGSITAALPPATTQQLLSDLVQRLPGDALAGSSAAAEASGSAADSAKATVAAKFAEAHGSLLAAGLVAAGVHISAGSGTATGGGAGDVSKAARAVAAELCNGDVQVALAAAQALGFMAIAGVAVLPVGDIKLPDVAASAKSAAGGTEAPTLATGYPRCDQLCRTVAVQHN